MKTLLLLSLLLVAGCASPTSELGHHSVAADEQAIRVWFDSWLDATETGDLELARSLIADDAVFIVPGYGKMDKEGYAAAATASDPNTDFVLDCALEDVVVYGDRAWLTARLGLVMTDKASGQSGRMAGYALSVLERRDGRWVVVRDMNTMLPVDD